MKTDTSKSTILVISMGFLILYLVFAWQWAVLVSLIVGVVGVLSSYLSKKIEWVWMKIAQLLGYIIPNILLTLMFFLFLYPIALLSKLFSKDPLMLSNKYETYFIDINKEGYKQTVAFMAYKTTDVVYVMKGVETQRDRLWPLI